MSSSEQSKTQEQITQTANVPEVTIGILSAVDERGTAFVNWHGNPNGEPCGAISTAVYSTADTGRSVALLFAGGDPRKPVIVGLLRQPLDNVLDVTQANQDQLTRKLRDEPDVPADLSIERDGERITLSADREIVIKCGKASITLTRAGKVLIRGEHLLSRSTGANRIRGGTIQLN